jgi:hypothetical protein
LVRYGPEYTPLPKSNKRLRVLLRKIHKQFPVDHSYEPFITRQVDDAIRASSNSTATGPDGLTPEHLKRMGRTAIKYLTTLFNLSIWNSDIPSILKQALILPVVKPGKLADQG